MYGGKSKKYLKKYGFQFGSVVLFTLAGTAFTVVGPRILGDATTAIFQGIMAKLNGTGGMDFEVIAEILVRLLVFYLAGTFFTFLAGWIMTGISERFTFEVRNDISEKLHVLPIQYYETKTAGEVLARITTDVDTLGQSINQSASQLLSAVMMLSGIVIMMFRISMPLAGCTVVILPISWLVVSFLTKRSRVYFERQQEILGEIHGRVEEAYTGHTVVKAFGNEKEISGRFRRENEALYDSAWRTEFYSGLMMLLTQMVGNIGYVLNVFFGGWLALNGALAVGDIQALIHYIRNLTQPVQQISQAAGMLQSASAAWKRIDAFLAEPEEESDPEDAAVGQKNAGDKAITSEKGHIRFEHVSFGYSPESPVLRDFSAEIKPGQRVAVIGQTGDGKTTLMKLLLRFYDVSEGAIYVDGKNITEYDRRELRKRFAVVLQDIWLFHGTILDNIRYGKPGATREEVRAAAVMASADDFIQKFPEGYDTVIDEENGSLSKGQRQLLTIARTILVNPDILIFDEATSSVDTRTEQQIQPAMENLMRGKTCFIIAHRLSTIRGADIVWRIENAADDYSG